MSLRQVLFLSMLLSIRPAVGEVFTSEFAADPVAEGWTLVQQWCDPTVWTSGSIHNQELDNEGCPGTGCIPLLRSVI